MAFPGDPNKVRERHMVDKFDVLAQMVRSAMEHGPLSAQEIFDGVRLSHEEFLYLYDNARRSIYAATR